MIKRKQIYNMLPIVLVSSSLLFYILVITMKIDFTVQFANKIVLAAQLLGLLFFAIVRKRCQYMENKIISRTFFALILFFWFWTLVIMNVVSLRLFGELTPIF